MKKIKTFLTMGATVAMLALPLAARAQDACAPEARSALYKDFLANRQNDQPKANEAAKKYLACPADPAATEDQKKIIDYLTRWTKAFEEGSKKNRSNEVLVALYNNKDYPKAFEIGREVLGGEPDNVQVLVHLGANGYLVAPLKNDQLVSEAVQHANKALQMLDSGKTLTDWGPLQNKDTAVAYLNYTVGSLTVEKDPSAALKNLLKSAQFETPLKKSAFTYALIAGAYETGPYAKQSEEYKAKYSGKEETPESKLALANINQLVDRMIDGYARAVALAATDQKLAAQKTAWTESLTQWYKFRNNSETTGMNELVAGILSKPLPPEPTPLTSLPAAPTSTPTSGGATPANGTVNGNGASSTTTKPATTTTAPTQPASANTKPAPGKPGNPGRPRQK